MSTLIQVIIINLIVSFDNIGVIALATRHLDDKEAAVARRMVIWLSLALKLVFMALIGYLFVLPWLHVRLIGGLMLVYVIYSMLKEQRRHNADYKGRKLLFVIFSIIAADISMSLDNVIAVASIVSARYDVLSPQGMSIAFLGFAISVPILLIFSEAIIHLINRSAALWAACAGYLGFIAASMIFKDSLVMMAFRYLNFGYTSHLAIVVGVSVFLASILLSKSKNENAKV